MSKRRSIYVEGNRHSNPIPTASRHGNLVMTSVINPIDPATGKVPEAAEDQCRILFAAIRRIVEAAGGTTDDIVKITVWMRDPAQRDLLNPEWVKMFPDEESRPARHTQKGAMAEHLHMQCDFTAWIA